MTASDIRYWKGHRITQSREDTNRYLVQKADKEVDYLSNGAIRTRVDEKADCVPVAVAACFDVSYEHALDFCSKKLGRRPSKPTSSWLITQTLRPERNDLLKEYLGKGVQKIFEPVTEYPNRFAPGGVNRCKMTVGTFLKLYPVGTYLLLVRNHAFSVKDGVVIGNLSDATSTRKIIETVIVVDY
jgi:hypothetical protein